MLDSRTYENDPGAFDPSRSIAKHDANAIPLRERKGMAYARGRCMELIFWVTHTYDIFNKETGEEIDGYQEVAMSYLSHLGSTIIEFKRRAQESEMDNENDGLTVKTLTRQVQLCFKGFADIPPLKKADAKGEASLTFPDKESFGVRKKVTRQAFICKHFT